MQKLKPALQFSQGRSLPWSGAELVNCYAEKADGDKRDDFAVMCIPGLDVAYTVGTGPIRGATLMNNILYVVSGGSFYSVTQAGVTTLIGGVSGSDMAQVVNNGTQVAICSGGQGYIYSGGSLTAPAALANMGSVGFIDGYFIWTSSLYDQFIYSAINDGLTYSGAVATVEGSPDGLKGVIVDHRELLFFGDLTIEIWYNSGNPDFAFERQGNAFIERGCVDRDSAVKIDNGVHFVGDDRIVYRLDGYQPTRISTHSIEYEIRNASYYRGFTYTQEGHKFYVLWTDVGTYCFDMATGAWHKRNSWGMNYWRCGGSINAWGGALLFDNQSNRLFRPNFDTYTEAGEIISLEISLPTIESGDRDRKTLYAFELVAETGVGNSSVPDPQVAMTFSRDGGRTWSNEMWRSLGRVGEYLTRAVWRQRVQFRQLQINLKITDACRRFVLGYYADIA